MTLYRCKKEYSYRISGDEYQKILINVVFIVDDVSELPGMCRLEFSDKIYILWEQINFSACEGVGYLHK